MRLRVCRSPAYRGFSLLELLAAVAVIGILVSLIVVSISTVLKHARMVEATSNLRQCYTAVNNYSIDHNGILPGNEGGNENQWVRDILEYVGAPEGVSVHDVQLYGDPNHREMFPERLSDATFTMNGFLGPRGGTGEWATSGHVMRLSEILYPDKVMLLMQGKHTRNGYFYPAAYPNANVGFPPDDVYDNNEVLVLAASGHVSFWGLEDIPVTAYGSAGYFWNGQDEE